MKLKRNSLWTLLILFIHVACASNEVRYNDPVELLNDDFWVNTNTLQIQVEAIEDEKIPYSLRREKACKVARSRIIDSFEKKYPSAKKLKYSYKVYKTLYTEKNNCRLVVHIYMKNLKDTLK